MTSPDLRLIVITDVAQAAPRSIYDIVRECLQAGAPAVQLRDKSANARELLDLALRFRELTQSFSALFFVNDRLDLALAAGADGVHLGPDDLPVAAARLAAPPLLIGTSTDDPAIAAARVADGASYIGCGAVFLTASKEDVRGERIGRAGLERVVRAVTVPVIGIGGITPTNVAEVAAAGAAGCAVIGALMKTEHPGRVTEQLLAAFR